MHNFCSELQAGGTRALTRWEAALGDCQQPLRGHEPEGKDVRMWIVYDRFMIIYGYMPVTLLWVTFWFADLNLCFFWSFRHVAHGLILILTSTKLHEQLYWLTDFRALLWLSWLIIMSLDCQGSRIDLVPACPKFLTCSILQSLLQPSPVLCCGLWHPLGHGVGTDGRVRLQFI